jgi:hypothetical protein
LDFLLNLKIFFRKILNIFIFTDAAQVTQNQGEEPKFHELSLKVEGGGRCNISAIFLVSSQERL